MLDSASPSALRQSAESLAGRLEILELGGLGIADVGAERFDDLWLRSGFPRSFFAPDNEASMRWRTNYIRTLATRDLPEFGVGLPAATIERFLALVAHTLLGIYDRASLLRNPRVGATWEGAVIEECIRQMGQTMTPYFWRTSNGAELDLLLTRGDTRIGIEVKRTDAPRITPSMRSALTDLHLDQLTVYYPCHRRYALSEQINVVPVAELDVPGDRQK